jgi:hypothetical protein
MIGKIATGEIEDAVTDEGKPVGRISRRRSPPALKGAGTKMAEYASLFRPTRYLLSWMMIFEVIRYWLDQPEIETRRGG